MNILILTPLHPIAIQSFIIHTAKQLNDNTSLTCIPLLAQTMADMNAQNKEANDIVKSYFTTLILCYSTFRGDKKLRNKMLNKNINIVVGNCDKKCGITFDHIFAFEEEPWSLDNDTYLDRVNKLVEEVNPLLTKQVEQFDWYTKDEAHYQFPTVHHLITMLKTLGAVNDDSSIQ